MDKQEKQVNQAVRLRSAMRIATWNVRTLHQTGKLCLLEHELTRHQLKIVGLAEVRWTSKGHFVTSNGNTVVYSGTESEHAAGVAVWLDKSVANSLIGYNPFNERLISI